MKKIDIVYCWVNNNDENWLKKKNKYVTDEISKSGANDKCRFNNNNELKYALRSLELYASWINKVYIVTDNQFPEWINLKHPKLKIIDHTEIIQNEYLPTFNSNTILHNLVNIPNLSEYFLYSDDDMYFADYVLPEFFYTKEGKPICRFTKPIEKLRESSYKQMIFNASNLLKNNKYNFPSYSPHHNVDAYRKSLIIECQNKFKNEIQSKFAAKFRTRDDIERIIYAYYAVATGKGVYKRVSKFDNFCPFYKRVYNYLTKNYSKDSQYFACKDANVYELLEKYHLKLFCINDTGETEDIDRNNAKTILNDLYPDKSTFEKDYE